MGKASELKKRLKKQGKEGLALDIDNTLSKTNLWWAEKLHDKYGSPEGLTPRQAVEKYGLSSKVPYWKNPESQAWMEEQRHSNKTQENYERIENALEAVLEINEMNPIVAYLTSRPESVEKGTRNWLKKHGFPQADLIMRPLIVPHHEGNAWKAGILTLLYPEITGIVDDDDSLAKNISPDYRGRIFLLNQNVAIASNNVVACKTWAQVVEAVKRSSYTER